MRPARDTPYPEACFWRLIRVPLRNCPDEFAIDCLSLRSRRTEHPSWTKNNQSNVDFSVGKRFPLTASKDLEFRAELFNLRNHANRDNPISNISTNDFGKVLSFRSSPRIVQMSLKFNW